MQTYKNLQGKSPITAYEIGDEYIAVQFEAKEIYRYSYQGVGRDHVETMKRLAVSGRSLPYITQHRTSMAAMTERSGAASSWCVRRQPAAGHSPRRARGAIDSIRKRRRLLVPEAGSALFELALSPGAGRS
jgi:hypothetical protein